MDVLAAKNRFLARPWVYDVLRPLVVGGIDHGAIARFCDVRVTDRVFDLGCGTASLLEHLECASYLGADLDRAALARAARFERVAIRFIHGDGWDQAFRDHRADVVLMMGLVHHLSDAGFRSLLDRLVRGLETPPRLVTMDPSYFRGRWLNNAFSRLDRGTHVREPEGYEALFRQCGLEIRRRGFLETRLGWVRYAGYHLSVTPGR
jgi:SAM-dependent methyltransferase